MPSPGGASSPDPNTTRPSAHAPETSYEHRPRRVESWDSSYAKRKHASIYFCIHVSTIHSIMDALIVFRFFFTMRHFPHTYCCREAANDASLGLPSNSCIKLLRNMPTSTMTSVMGNSTQLRKSLRVSVQTFSHAHSPIEKQRLLHVREPVTVGGSYWDGDLREFPSPPDRLSQRTQQRPPNSCAAGRE